MRKWFFASDLHGRLDRYRKLFALLRRERPQALLLGGDLLPNSFAQAIGAGEAAVDFIAWLAGEFETIGRELGAARPEIVLILGNDDPRREEQSVLEQEAAGVWRYAHARRLEVDGRALFGYAHVTPSPFLLKDWERYDVSRFVDPGCISPEEGLRSVPVSADDARYSTIAQDLTNLTGGEDLTEAVFLFHSPPYKSALDRAALDGQMIDHVPLDPHVGSIAIRRFLEHRQPLISLHGHIHESARLTGAWRERIGRTHCLSAAHDGPELALVDFDPERPEQARRRLL